MVLIVLVNVKVDAALALICVAVVQNLLYKLNLLNDMARCVRLDAGRQHVQGIHGLVITQGVVLDYLHGLQLLQTGFLGNLVLTLIGIMLQMAYIGDVTHVTNLVAQVLQVAEQYVKCDGGACVTQMRITIYGRTAHVHAYVRRVQCFKQLFLSGQGVVDGQFVFHITCVKFLQLT